MEVYGVQRAQPVATGGKSDGSQKRLKQGKTAAAGCERLPRAPAPRREPASAAQLNRSFALPDLFGLVRIDRLFRGSRARPVDMNGDALGICRRFDELEGQRRGQVLEQG